MTTDDASNWDLSASRDGFVFGSMIVYRAAAGGLEDEPLAEAFQRLTFSYVIAHTAHTVIFGEVLIEIFAFGLMPSGIWFTGLLNSIMRSLGVVLAGSVDAISVGDDNSRGPPRANLSVMKPLHASLWH